ncbi:MATE efflux family protein [Sesbania bispinosa]|nr:MATE efflux family protein [Sesbania bispinosa]
MCTGAESRGNINGEPVISKVGEYHEDTMGSGDTTSNSLLHRLHHYLTSLLPTLSVSEVSTKLLSLSVFWFSANC